jgi:DNA-binding CsgD family transcriptional regulator
MRQQDYLDISQAPDSVTFRRRMLAFAHWMDFPMIGATLVTEGGANGPAFSFIGTRPPDFTSGADRKLIKKDPVVAQLRGSHKPFAYDQDYYVAAGAPELWEMASPYGFRTGIQVAFQISSDQQVLVGLDRERSLPRSGAKLHVLLSNLECFASYAADAARRFVREGEQQTNAAALTLREREILLRVLEGKSNWVIAHLMQVSENTVKFHLKSIFRKLGVSSRIVAATRAQAMGLL